MTGTSGRNPADACRMHQRKVQIEVGVQVSSPYIVAVGGTLRPGSSTENAMKHVLSAAERAGARTRLISGPALQLPMYQPENPERSDAARDLVAQLALADGII